MNAEAGAGLSIGESMNIPIRNPVDTMVARREVRAVARKAGLNLTEQASIALATWSLCSALGLGSFYRGEILIECIQDENARSGVRVVCIARGNNDAPQTFGQTRWIVDELSVNKEAPDAVEVIAIKWKQEMQI